MLQNHALPGASLATEVIPYRHETSLFWISAFLAVLMWLYLTVFTLGVWLLLAPLFGLVALFGTSLLIAWIKGNSVRVTAEQFPDLHAQYQQCCTRLGMPSKMPELYLAQADGMLNAMATRFMRRDYVVLLSNVVDALADRPEAIKFYMGHELGHIKRKHLSRHWWLWPGLIMPLVSPAYARACEYTCDRHGMACCNNLEDAKRALGVLVAGEARWKTLNLQAFEQQAQETGKFWMAVHELTADYPWLCKRMVVLEHPNATFARRSVLAWLIAAASPRMGYGGAIIGFLLWLTLGLLALALVVVLALGKDLPDASQWLQQKPLAALTHKISKPTRASQPVNGATASNDAPEESVPKRPLTEVLPDVHGRLTQTARALDDYAASHRGKWPHALDELALPGSVTEGINYESGKSPALTAQLNDCQECDELDQISLFKFGKRTWECYAYGVGQEHLDKHAPQCQAITATSAKPGGTNKAM